MALEERPPENCEIAIVGAGPAGATIAALLAQRGRSVVVLERDRMPRDKLCGEFLSYESHPILEGIGAWGALADRGVPIDRALVVSRSGAEVHTALERAAIGISRLTLDVALIEAARAQGALVFERTEVRAVEQDRGGATLTLRRDGGELALRAELVVGAWGRRARLDRRLDRPFVRARHPWVGLKRHHLVRDDRTRRELERAVELHAFEGGYCGVNLVDGGVANVCALVERRALDAAAARGWEGLELLMRTSPSLRRRLEGLWPHPDRSLCAVAEVPFERKRVADARIFWVGDASGMITPMTGDGQAMAIEGASLLAPRLDALLVDLGAPDRAATIERAGRSWGAEWARHFRVRHGLGRAAQALLVRPRAAEAALRLGAAIPALPRLIARATRGAPAAQRG